MRRISNEYSYGKDHWLLLETEEIAPLVRQHARTLVHPYWGARSWCGDSWLDFQEMSAKGDNARVERTEKILREIEDQMPVSKGWRNVDDVVGAVPNVPAFLAGHPQHMRRRQRVSKETAPLAIYMDLTSSAGIDESLIEKRGVVLLALVRLLVEHRSVELWVGTTIGHSRMASSVAWRIETTPLDLARAAYHISATGMSRRFGYGMTVVEQYRESRWGGGWGFGSYDQQVRTSKDRTLAVFPDREMLHIPPIFLNDPMTTQPVAWLKRVMSQYVNQEEAA